MLKSIALNVISIKIIPSLMGLFFAILSSRVIGPNKIGEFVIYFTIYNLFRLICEGGFSLVLSDQKYSEEYLHASNLHYVIFGLIGCGVITIISSNEISIKSIMLQISLLLFCIQTYYQNNLKMNLAYYQLNYISFYSSFISLLISIILVFITKNEIILYLRYVLLEFTMLIFLRSNSSIRFKFGKLARLKSMYFKSIHFIFQGIIESVIEILLVNSIRITLGIGSVGYFNRSTQLVETGIKMPAQGFRAAYIGLVTKGSRKIFREIGIIFLFIILSTLITYLISARGGFLIEYIYGSDWLPILSWLKYGIIVALAFSFEQISSANMYILKRENLIIPINVIIKFPVFILIYQGFDLNSWFYWSGIYFISTTIYLIITTVKVYNEYRNCNNLDEPRSSDSIKKLSRNS